MKLLQTSYVPPETISIELTKQEAAALCAVLGSLDTFTIEKLTDKFLKENEQCIKEGDEDTKNVAQIVTNDQTHPYGYMNDLFCLLADHFVEQ